MCWYCTLMIGCHFSHAFSGIAEGLQAGDIGRRRLLAAWTDQDTEMEPDEIQLAIGED